MDRGWPRQPNQRGNKMPREYSNAEVSAATALNETTNKVLRKWASSFKQWYYSDDGGLSWYAEYAPCFNEYVNEQLARNCHA